MDTKPPLIDVVDDEESVGRALQRLLGSVGYAVAVFTSGDAFLQSLADNRPDCVVLDVHMPVLNGLEVQKRLQGIQSDIPVVILTGHDSPRSRQLAMDQGAAAYVTKPVDAQSLIDAINTALTGHAPE